MSHMSKISVLMPVYNSEKHLKEAITSVINQSVDDIELICVNDGSTDSSLDILNHFSKKYDFIKVFSTKNHGSGDARNFALSKASGDYIAYLDSDDIFINPDALKEMYTVAVKNDALMVSANLKGIELNGKLVNNHNLKRFKTYDTIPPEDYGIPYSFYKNIFKKDFLVKNKITFPDYQRGQDPVFLAKILTSVNEIYTVPIDLYGFRYPKNGSLLKINTYQKRYDYIMHFKETFKILGDANFNEMKNNYYLKLLEYINAHYNDYSKEIHDIVCEIFPNDYNLHNLFKKPKISVIYSYDGDLYNIKNILNNEIKEIELLCINCGDDLSKLDSRIRLIDEANLFDEINGEKYYFYNRFDEDFKIGDGNEFEKQYFLFKLRNIKSNDDVKQVREYFKNGQKSLDNYHKKCYCLLKSSKDFDEYKSKIMLVNLECEINNLKDENKQLKIKRDKLKKFNTQLINSKSLKLTKALRKIGNLKR